MMASSTVALSSSLGAFVGNCSVEKVHRRRPAGAARAQGVNGCSLRTPLVRKQVVDSSARVLNAGRAAFLPPLKTRTPAAKRAFKPRAAVAVDERPAPTMAPPPPVEGMKTVTVKVRTGAEADAGIGHNAYFYVVGSFSHAPDTGLRYPEESSGYFELKGPFRPETEIGGNFQVPAGFNIKGVVLYNPQDNSPWGKFTGALADFLNKDNLTFGGNYLNIAVKLFGMGWITTGQWYVNDVLVDGHEFPVYSWVLDNESQIAFTGKAHLPQDTPPGLRHWRRLKLIQNQDMYDYQPYNDLSVPPDNADVNSAGYRPTLDPYPAHQWVERSGPKLEQVPKDEQFRLDKRYDFGHYTLTSVLTALLSDPMAGFLKLVSSFGIYPKYVYKSLGEYTKKVFEGFVHYKKPFVSKFMDWWSDKAFGFQTVAGINPIQIARVGAKEDLPSTIDFEELDAALRPRLATAGTTLEGAMKDGKLFKLDFTFLEAFQGVVNGHQPWKEHTTDKGGYKIKALGEDVWVKHMYSVRGKPVIF